MAKKFTKLYLGILVHTVGSRVFRKLTTEQPVVEDELQGTWVLNATPQGVGIPSDTSVYSLDFTTNGQQGFTISTTEGNRLKITDITYNLVTSLVPLPVQNDVTVYNGSSWSNDNYRTIQINSKLEEVTNGASLLDWLTINATKQSAN